MSDYITSKKIFYLIMIVISLVFSLFSMFGCSNNTNNNFGISNQKISDGNNDSFNNTKSTITQIIKESGKTKSSVPPPTIPN